MLGSHATVLKSDTSAEDVQWSAADPQLCLDGPEFYATVQIDLYLLILRRWAKLGFFATRGVGPFKTCFGRHPRQKN